MASINPRVTPSQHALDVAEGIRKNGGNMTAEEVEFLEQYERKGSAPSRTRALESAGPDGAIVGKAGSWTIYRKRANR